MAFTDLRWVRWSVAHWQRLLVLGFGSILPLFAFALIAEDIVEREPFAYDPAMLSMLHNAAAPGYDVLMRVVSNVGHSWGVVPLDIALALVLLMRSRWAQAQYWIAAVGGAGLINWIAKHLFARERPAMWEVITRLDSYSFPSGHAMGSMAAMSALVVLLWLTRWRYPMLLFAIPFVLIVGLSRVYLGAHYPSDILAGWAASLAWVIGVSALMWDRLARAESAQNGSAG